MAVAVVVVKGGTGEENGVKEEGVEGVVVKKSEIKGVWVKENGFKRIEVKGFRMKMGNGLDKLVDSLQMRASMRGEMW